MNKINDLQIKEYFNKDFDERSSRVFLDDAYSYNYQKKAQWFTNHLKKIKGCMLDIGCNIGNLEYMIRKDGITKDQLKYMELILQMNL